MKCPQCGSEMVKAKKADVWLCEECGTRCRVEVDIPEVHPAPLPYVPVPEQPRRRRRWPIGPVWYGPSPLDDGLDPYDSRSPWETGSWVKTTAAGTSSWPDSACLRATSKVTS